MTTLTEYTEKEIEVLNKSLDKVTSSFKKLKEALHIHNEAIKEWNEVGPWNGKLITFKLEREREV